jgi:hypothetical protein
MQSANNGAPHRTPKTAQVSSVCAQHAPSYRPHSLLNHTHTHTHTQQVPDGDVLFVSGDLLTINRHFSTRYSKRKLKRIANWMRQLPHPHKVFIAGNHDAAIEALGAARVREIFRGVTYLEDSGAEIGIVRCKRTTFVEEGTEDVRCKGNSVSSISDDTEGVHHKGTSSVDEGTEDARCKGNGAGASSISADVQIEPHKDTDSDGDDIEDVGRKDDGRVVAARLSVWGSPYNVGSSKNDAFQSRLTERINAVPRGVDVLLTHGPLPHETLRELRPRLHVSGHVHYRYGVTRVGDTVCVNASILGPTNSPTNLPIIVDLPAVEQAPSTRGDFARSTRPQ